MPTTYEIETPEVFKTQNLRPFGEALARFAAEYQQKPSPPEERCVCGHGEGAHDHRHERCTHPGCGCGRWRTRVGVQ